MTSADTSEKQEADVREVERMRGLEIELALAFVLFPLIGAAMGIWLHWDAERLGFSSLGTACLLWALIVWRHGIISYSTRGGSRAKVSYPPLPPRVLVPLLLLVGLVLIGSATPTAVGAVLAVPVRIGASARDFIATTWNLALVVGLLGYALFLPLSGVFRGDRDRSVAGAIFLLLFLGVFALGYLLYAIGAIDAETYRNEWRRFLKPVRVVGELFD